MLNKLFEKINNPRTYLVLANIFLVFFVILLSNINVLPVKRMGDFIFYSAIFLAFALYRPGWAFLFFVGTIVLENINLAPRELGIMIRPYQFIGGLTIVAILIRLLTGRLGFKLPKWNWYDFFLIIFIIAGFISACGSLSLGTLKQSLIATSFVVFYFLTRIFIQNLEDLKRIVPFFLSSSVIVVLYGIWQNVRFMHGLYAFEAMPGRPNATFMEADWYGIFLVLLLGVLYSLIYYFRKQSGNKNLLVAGCWLLAVLILASLVLTVSRSAWLGALAATFIFFFIIWTNLELHFKNWQWRTTIGIKLQIISALAASLAIIYIFNLTNFQLFNRVQSTGSGLQKITVSCSQNITLPEKIGSTDELAQYGCKHINLEDIANEKSEGDFVTETFRTDPNVNIRGIIYQKSWAEINNHPLLGIGWANIGKVLGSDNRGIALNSSNIFLEIWLGSGLLGIISFSLFWFGTLIFSIKNYFSTTQNQWKTFNLCVIIAWFGLTVSNLFNAGIFLGFLWIFLAITQIRNENRD